MRAESPADCDRTRHWFKSDTLLFFAAGWAVPAPPDPAKLKQHSWEPSSLGFYDVANEDNQWHRERQRQPEAARGT
jgi:hypothetical protein